MSLIWLDDILGRKTKVFENVNRKKTFKGTFYNSNSGNQGVHREEISLRGQIVVLSKQAKARLMSHRKSLVDSLGDV